MQFEIFVSHDSRDGAFASALKRMLEGIFPSVDVFVSGDDLRGGQLWASKLRERLESADVIVALLTQQSATSGWVHFEAGAGFAQEKTIPVCLDGVTKEKVTPPLGLLQARNLDLVDAPQIVADIARRAGYRDPSSDPSTIDKLAAALQEIERIIQQRNQTGAVDVQRANHSQGATPTSPLRISVTSSEHIEKPDGYELIFVALELHNPTARGFTITSTVFSFDPDEIILAPVTYHREGDGSVCFGFQLPSGEAEHQRRPESEAPRFPIDLPSRQSAQVVAALAVRRKLDAPEHVESDGFSLTFLARDSRNRTIGKLQHRLRLPQRTANLPDASAPDPGVSRA